MSTLSTVTLADLAVRHPAASRVFYRRGLDFCCHGTRPLGEACEERGLDPDVILREIEGEDDAFALHVRWDERPLGELIEHIVGHYHRRLREELPQLVEMAAKVEHKHADKAACPRGLHTHLVFVHQSVLDHLAKEEQVLFPMILAGRGAHAAAPINVMEVEHDDHAQNLRKTRALTGGLVVPPEACPTWQALYLRLDALEIELMEHIHLENNVLVPRARLA
jgi:regulator of cell morphogenesis and NO signaling